MDCKGTPKDSCNPPKCLWANGAKLKYCRSKSVKSKTPKAKVVKAKSAKAKVVKAKSVKSKKSPKAKTVKAKMPKVEKWKVTYVKLFFPEDGEDDTTFNVASVVLRSSKEKVEYDFPGNIITMDEYEEKVIKGKNYKLNHNINKETSITFTGFKMEQETSDIGSIHDGTHGLVSRGLTMDSKDKVKKQHIADMLEKLLV
jgi:hypothetical protein